ncbi:MAG TPA: hypothetical protein VMW34_05695 [Anaerolineales bacterium]|jgi:hypothetical protein|nr:hypothetical protein [Anaerolineales bacterium]
MNNQQIGRSGELLLQYKLLLLGIESSHMKTSSGIDLVAYSPRNRRAYTVQVKTNEKPTPSGDNGKLSLEWWVPDDCPADLVAFVDLSTISVWLFSTGEIPKYSQKRYRGRQNFYFFVDPTVDLHSGQFSHQVHFNDFVVEKRAPVFF